MILLIDDHTRNKAFRLADVLTAVSEEYRTIYLAEETILKNYGVFLSLFKNLRSMSAWPDRIAPGLVMDLVDSRSARLRHPELGHLVLPVATSVEELDRLVKWIAKQSSENVQMCPPVPAGGQDAAFRFVPDTVLDMIGRMTREQDYSGKKVLISAGPTIEDIDPVRYLTNRSSGKMGIALARAAWLRGADVRLVIGPTHEYVPSYLDIVRVRSAHEMAGRITASFADSHLYIASAAVADFTPAVYRPGKIKKGSGQFVLELNRTRDILEALAGIKTSQQIIGFSVETDNEIENSLEKMRRKNLDMIVVNNPGEKGAAFESDTNIVTILKKKGNSRRLPLMSKLQVAHVILDEVLTMERD